VDPLIADFSYDGFVHPKITNMRKPIYLSENVILHLAEALAYEGMGVPVHWFLSKKLL